MQCWHKSSVISIVCRASLSPQDSRLEVSKTGVTTCFLTGVRVMQDESVKDNKDISESQQGSITKVDAETPSQADDAGVILSKASLLPEDVEGYKTPEELMLARPLPATIRGTKKFLTKTRRVISSPIPYIASMGDQGIFSEPALKDSPSTSKEQSTDRVTPIRREGDTTAGRDGESSQHSSEGAHVQRIRSDSAEGDWSTVVLKGGGEAFVSASADFPNMGDSDILMLAEGQPTSSNVTVRTPATIPVPGSLASPGRSRAQGCKRSHDDIELSDMELDDTIDS